MIANCFRRKVSGHVLCLGAGMLVLSACGKPTPGGQVLAVVNGEPITRSQLNLELSISGIPQTQWSAARDQMLQNLIDRKLLAQSAEESGIDKQPDTILAQDRAREIILAQTAAQMTVAALQKPSLDQDNGNRAGAEPAQPSGVFEIDQIRFQAPANLAQIRALRSVRSMAQLETFLEARNIAFERATNSIKADQLDETARRDLLASKNGEPIIVISGGVAVANALIGEGAGGGANGSIDLGGARLEQGLVKRQEALRKAAEISYAKGFGPKQASPAPR